MSNDAALNPFATWTKVYLPNCGQDAFTGGGASNDFGGTLTIADTVMSGNTGGHWTSAASGSVKNAGTAVGTNCKSITLTNSMLQGL